MSSQTESVEEKPIAPEEAKKAPAMKKAKKAVKAAPTSEKAPSYQEMVKQAVVETNSRTGSSLITVKKFVIEKFPVDAVKAPARILKAVNKLVAAGELVPAAPAGRKGAHRYKLAPPGAGAGFRTALQHSINRKNVFRVSTGSMEFNKLLGGGLESMAITEVFGETGTGTGKTQLAHTLCVTTQLPGEGGFTGGKVIYIDTENTFRPDRLRPIADRYNLNQDAVLDNVLYSRAYTSEQQMELLDFVCAKFHEEPGVFKLLVVDSVMALFRVDFSGRGELAERQQNLAQMLSKLQKISEEYNVAVLVTNQMTADPGATMSFQADPKKPIAFASTTRISMRKGRGELRVAKIYDSPDLPENEATFAITAGGLDDAKD